MKHETHTVYRAPGKLFLIGEYSVLEGFPAVVMAVDRYVELSPTSVHNPDGLVSMARFACADILNFDPLTSGYRADSSSFFMNGSKLGLGSSSAVTAAAVASVFHEAGRDLESTDVKFDIWRVSRRIHNDFQKEQGSGADLFASIFGGINAFCPFNNAASACAGAGKSRPSFSSWSPAPPLNISFFWSGKSSSTPAMISAVRRMRDHSGQEYEKFISRMGILTRELIGGNACSAFRTIGILKEYGLAMDELGKAAGAEIITEQMRTAMSIASSLGGAAKPSGAGGGDFLMSGFDRRDAEEYFTREIERLGFLKMKMGTANRGVHADAAKSMSAMRN